MRQMWAFGQSIKINKSFSCKLPPQFLEVPAGYRLQTAIRWVNFFRRDTENVFYSTIWF